MLHRKVTTVFCEDNRRRVDIICEKYTVSENNPTIYPTKYNLYKYRNYLFKQSNMFLPIGPLQEYSVNTRVSYL